MQTWCTNVANLLTFIGYAWADVGIAKPSNDTDIDSIKRALKLATFRRYKDE